jgi:hypothetical protein
VATGTHKTILLGGQNLTWANPGPNHFQDVDVSTAASLGTVGFGTSTVATGQLIALPPGSPPVISGSLTAAGANVNGLLWLNGALVLNGGTITAFNNVTDNFAPSTGAALTVLNTGAGGPLTFSNLSFASSNGGFYISATSTVRRPVFSRSIW